MKASLHNMDIEVRGDPDSHREKLDSLGFIVRRMWSSLVRAVRGMQGSLGTKFVASMGFKWYEVCRGQLNE